MQFSTDLSRTLEAAGARRNGAPVRRPALGAIRPRTRGAGWWLLPAVDFVTSSIALTFIVRLAGSPVFPAFPLAPTLLVAVYGLLHGYACYPPAGSAPGETRIAWPVIHVIVAALFAWFTSLIAGLDAGSELALWGAVVLLDTGSRKVSCRLLRRLYHPERWLLVGDEATAELLRRYQPLRAHATLVAAVEPSANGSKSARRQEALEAVEHHRAHRAVIATRHIDDEGLVELVRAFKSIGVPVSLLPRPLDLLEAPAATASEVGGVPLVEVEALPTHAALPYHGPDRRHDRRTRVSVVVPAKDEARNIGQVLGRLPENIHEVILVDGHSQDDTVEVARLALPKVRVLTQGGRGKGDALRTGFAAVTGNIVVMLDADGSADPAEIPRFVEALEAGADFAKGSRFLPGGGSDDLTPLRRLGNSFLSGAANVLHGTNFTDLCYGYNAFWTRCLPFISLDVPGFEVETLINLRIADAGMKITEVPSYEANRISGQSNLKTFRDGFRVLRTIVGEAHRRQAIHPERHPIAAPSPEETTAA